MKKILNYFLIFALLSCPVFSQQLSSQQNLNQNKEKQEASPIVILGSGVGALTSAIYLQRAGLNTLVIEGENPGGAIAQSPSVHNWPGEVEINGQDLIEKIRSQAEANGAKIVAKEVVAVNFEKRPFSITVRDTFDHNITETIEAKACIIAMGSKPNLLGIPGETAYWTKGVYNCAVCDGSLFQGKTVAVIGGGDSAILEAEYLSKIAKKVYVILRSDHFRTVESLRKNTLIEKANVEILYNTKVDQIVGNGQKVAHLNLSTKKELPVDGVFVAIGSTPNSSIFSQQLDMDKNGYIRLTEGQQTSVPGVFAIGDVVDPVYKQAISAAGDGAKAALQLERDLSTFSQKNVLQKSPQEIVVQKTSATETTHVPDISSSEDLYAAIGNNGTSLVVEFYSPYCGPCKSLNSELEKVAASSAGKFRFLKVNVTQFSELAGSYNVYGVPTLLIFNKQGKLIKKASGLEQVQKVLKELQTETL